MPIDFCLNAKDNLRNTTFHVTRLFSSKTFALELLDITAQLIIRSLSGICKQMTSLGLPIANGLIARLN